MGKDIKAFQIKVNGRILDYRLGKELDLDQARAFFERRYLIKKFWSGGRHILGMVTFRKISGKSTKLWIY